MEPFSNPPLDALLRWPLSPGRAWPVSSENNILSETCKPKKFELPFPGPCQIPCLILVHRQLQLAHDLAQVVQRRFRAVPSSATGITRVVGHR